MGLSRRALAALAMSGSLLAGGAVGATVFSASPSVAATTPTTSSSSGATTSPSAAAAPGTDTSNNTAAHEATESAQRQADEDAGKVGPGHSNTDPAHEA